jgi:hypothetical protein
MEDPKSLIYPLGVIGNMVRVATFAPGNVAEVGVFHGGSAKVICQYTPLEKRIFLFDTFVGIPFQSEYDFHKIGDMAIEETPEEMMRNLNLPANVTIHKGIFPQETGKFVINEMFSFVHLDMDVYESYKQCLPFFFPRMTVGSILLMHDYVAPTTQGAKKAIDEFFESVGVQLEFISEWAYYRRFE